MVTTKQILREAAGAALPWKTPDAVYATEYERNGRHIVGRRRSGYGGDRQEQIDRCLSCQRPECTNCLE